MNLCYKINLWLLLLLKSSEQNCLDNQKANKQNDIPFITRIITNQGECHGIIISRDYVLTNAKCVNGSVAVNIQLSSRKNSNLDSTADMVLRITKINLHENFRKISQTHYQNDWALLQLPSLMNFSVTLRSASFLTYDEHIESIDNKTAVVVWKAGHLTSAVGVIQKTDTCIGVYGPDFNPSYHFCILISDEVFITYVDDSLSHPVLVNNDIVGFAIPYPVSEEGGKMYRVMKLPTVLNWVKKYTIINQDNVTITDLYQDVDDCLFQNTDRNTFKHNSLTLILQQLVQEELKGIHKEVNTIIDSMQSKIDGTTRSFKEFKTNWRNEYSELELNIGNKSLEMSSVIKERFMDIEARVESEASEIRNDIKETYHTIQKTLTKKEEQIIKQVIDKFSDIEKLLREKDQQLNSISERLVKLEKEMGPRK